VKVGQRLVRRGRCGRNAIGFLGRRGRTLLVLVAGALLILFPQAKGSTIQAKSASLRDVSSAVASARDGDIVLIPAGTVSWTSTLSITKGITLQGQTTIVGNDPSKFRVTEGTVILDDVPRTSTNQRLVALIYGNFSASQRPRITGITFKVGSVTAQASTTTLLLTGTCPNVRIDHCSFYKLSRYNIRISGNLFGVMDHCWIVNDSGSEKFWISHDMYGGKTFGDGSWADDPKFGTDQAFYIEDCAFTSINGKHGSIDGAGGMRRVVRHCYFLDCYAQLHGTESNGRNRSSRMVETYLNTFDMRGSGATGAQHRGGTGLYWGNTFLTDPTFTRGYELRSYRQMSAWSQWPIANGQCPLDSNDTEGDYNNPQYVANHTPHLYFSGTCTASGTNSCRMDGAGWKTNHWAGFHVTNKATRIASLILSNTSDTLTLAAQWSGKSQSQYSNGDAFAIYRLARASLDQPGMGKGDLVTGIPPTNKRWPNQQSEPLYAWLNTNNGSDYTNFFTLPADMPFPTIKANRDFFNWNTSFDGTTGVGAGLRSDRPSTCTKGVGYWATDEKTLYVAAATNKWSVYYRPFVYPHPLATVPGTTSKLTRH
jgi:hypothetical protein